MVPQYPFSTWWPHGSPTRPPGIQMTVSSSTLCLKNQLLALKNDKRLKIQVNLERGSKESRLSSVFPTLPSWLATPLRLSTSGVI